MSGSSREVILARIRAGIGEKPLGVPPKRPEGGWWEGSKSDGIRPSLGTRRTSRQVRELFRDRVSEYRAEVSASSPASLSTGIAGSLGRRGVRRLLVPHGIPSEWLASVDAEAVEILVDGRPNRPLSVGQLASVHGVLTGCALGIAETGTIILDSGPTQGRRALSLLPDYHLCVVFSSQLKETVPEAVCVLAGGFAFHRRPVTLVSGPSATSDIELIRVEGVHGPRSLEVILVEDTE